MQVLYRKYRPRLFAEVVGQGHITRTLKNAVDLEKPAHAYLFIGTRGVGKTTLARIMARSVNCQEAKNGEACLQCRNCLLFENGGFMDLIEIDAASNTGVDNIRELIDHVRFQPVLGKYKICIIDEVHMLSKGAFNALLKTLEEPPPHIIFILATTELQKVPATIISRTQRFDFNKLSHSEIVNQLEFVLKSENSSLDKAIINAIAKRAEGGMRDALGLLDKVMSLGPNPTSLEAGLLLGLTDESVSEELFKLITNGDSLGVSNFIEGQVSLGADFLILNRNFLEFLREKLQKLVEAKAEHISLNTGELLFVIRLFLRSYKEFSQSPSPEFPMLLAAIEASLKFRRETVVNTPNVGIVDKKGVEEDNTNTSTETVTKQGGLIDTTEKYSQKDINEPHFSKPLDTVTESELLPIWNSICLAVKAVNGPLGTLIKNSPVLEVIDGTVVLEVKYHFHKEHLESIKNQSIVAEAIFSIIGKKLRVRARIVKTGNHEDQIESKNGFSDVLKVFGGELVE